MSDSKKSDQERFATLKRWFGPGWVVFARSLLRGYGVPRWGNLRRTKPFSEYYGFERGTPVDRYYLQQFLEKHRERISGNVLEIQMPGYTKQYGSNVVEAHSVDIAPEHAPTYTCDLASSESVIPSDYYDCFLLPNTLCVLKDIDACLAQAYRVIKPGGVILATTAGFVPLTPDLRDYWHLSAAGWREVCQRAMGDSELVIESHGNCLSATAAIMGLAYEELSATELNVQDPRYPVLVSVYCRKPK